MRGRGNCPNSIFPQILLKFSVYKCKLTMFRQFLHVPGNVANTLVCLPRYRCQSRCSAIAQYPATGGYPD